MRWARILVGVLCAAFMTVGSMPVRAAVSDTDVKAAFLPRFARYVTWPAFARPANAEGFVLCVIGHDPFGSKLAAAARSQSVDGHRITIRQLDSTAAAGQCHIAFVGGSASQSIAQMLSALDGRPILTVTDARHGDSRGMIHFVISGGRVRFHIDEADASRNGLSISSRLLALALSVKQR